MKKILVLLLLISASHIFVYGQNSINEAESIKKDTVTQSTIAKQDTVKASYKTTEKSSKGFKGISEFGMAENSYENENYIKWSGSLVYQFNPYLYLGGGSEIIMGRWPLAIIPRLNSFCTFYLPIFTIVRVNFKKGKYIPFIDFKSGYTFGLGNTKDGNGYYYNPSIGIKDIVSPKVAVTVSIGYAKYNWAKCISLALGFEF